MNFQSLWLTNFFLLKAETLEKFTLFSCFEKLKMWNFGHLKCLCSWHFARVVVPHTLAGIVSFRKQELEIQAYLFESGLLTEEWRMQIRQHQEWSIKWKKGFSFPYSALGLKPKLWIWSNYLKTFFATHHFNSSAGNFDMSNLKIILHTIYLFLFIVHFHFIVFEF